jgi:hypothetical protein
VSALDPPLAGAMDFFLPLEKKSAKDEAISAVADEAMKHSAMDFFLPLEKKSAKDEAISAVADEAKKHSATDVFDIFGLEKSSAWSPIALVNCGYD